MAIIAQQQVGTSRPLERLSGDEIETASAILPDEQRLGDVAPFARRPCHI